MAIGPAPKAGKPRWTELAQKLKEPKRAAAANRIAQGPDFHALDTDVRFARVMETVSDKSKADPPATWSNANGVKVVSVASRPGRVSLHIDEKAEPEFGAFLVENLDKIYAEFKQRGGKLAYPVNNTAGRARPVAFLQHVKEHNRKKKKAPETEFRKPFSS